MPFSTFFVKTYFIDATSPSYFVRIGRFSEVFRFVYCFYGSPVFHTRCIDLSNSPNEDLISHRGGIIIDSLINIKYKITNQHAESKNRWTITMGKIGSYLQKSISLSKNGLQGGGQAKSISTRKTRAAIRVLFRLLSDFENHTMPKLLEWPV